MLNISGLLRSNNCSNKYNRAKQDFISFGANDDSAIKAGKEIVGKIKQEKLDCPTFHKLQELREKRVLAELSGLSLPEQEARATRIKLAQDRIRSLQEKGIVAQQKYAEFKANLPDVSSVPISDFNSVVWPISQQTGVATCREMANKAAADLQEQGFQDSSVIMLRIRKEPVKRETTHYFAGCDFPEDSEISKPETWEDAKIACPWSGVVADGKKATQIFKKMLNYQPNQGQKISYHTFSDYACLKPKN